LLLADKGIRLGTTRKNYLEELNKSDKESTCFVASTELVGKLSRYTIGFIFPSFI
jgi:hypothetical protein